MKRLLVSTMILVLVSGVAYAQSLVQTGDPAKRGLKESDFPRTKKLGDGVYSYEALRGGDPGGFMTTNSLIVITSDGVLVADGQGNVKQTQEMIDAIKKLTPQPIKYFVICSDHGDHTGGDAAFPQSTIFISSPVSKKTMEGAGGRGNNPPPRVATESVADKRTIKLGSTEIQILNLGRAHTGGDLMVYVPKDKVLFMSEAYLHRLFPAMRSAYPSEWVETVKKAGKMNATWYIPGHGFVDDPKTLKEELVVYRKAMETVIAEATRLHKAGVPCLAPAPGTPANQAPKCEAQEKANWGDLKDWTLRGGQEVTAIRKVYEELEGKLK